MNDFDLSIIGAGPAGYVGAIRAAQLGARVCLIERAEVGGVCLNRGCIPTKTLTSFVALLEKVKLARKYGIRIEGEVTADLGAAMNRKREVVATMVKGITHLLGKRGVTLESGEARFVKEKTLEVSSSGGSKTVTARKFLVATGSRPAELPALSFDGSGVISSDEALELDEVPASVLIVGGGSIGCEFAFILSGLGAEVTVVEILDRILPTEDHDVSALMERELKKRKVKVMVGDGVASCERVGSGVKCSLDSGRQVEAAKVLVSVGRRLNTAELGLEDIGVERGAREEILVSGTMETNVPGVYAAGDVVGKKMYAHSASREAIVAVSNALGQKKEMDYSAVPSCIFTSPEVASVGMTERDAQQKGLDVRTGVFSFRSLGKAHVLDEISGMVKFVADAKDDRILGVHVVGAHASELIHEGAVAVAHRLTASELGETIHAHPTLSEAMMEAADAVRGLSIHSPQ
ncbi:MAG: dihydrolipoyl dehydrogenase [Candidatus Eiseniibacteriota bacterium]|nr:MAG: dihydrolipoyl dehydrogenase [Candidatus Eisenbacteria bacterium]